MESLIAPLISALIGIVHTHHHALTKSQTPMSKRRARTPQTSPSCLPAFPMWRPCPFHPIAPRCAAEAGSKKVEIETMRMQKLRKAPDRNAVLQGKMRCTKFLRLPWYQQAGLRLHRHRRSCRHCSSRHYRLIARQLRRLVPLWRTLRRILRMNAVSIRFLSYLFRACDRVSCSAK